MLTNQELQTLHNMGNEAADAANEIERLRGIVPEVQEKLNDELCSENERLRTALAAMRPMLDKRRIAWKKHAEYLDSVLGPNVGAKRATTV